MICYDIADPERLRRTAKILENFGIRIQKSFFQCEMSIENLKKLEREILSVVKTKKDRLFIYPLCEACSKKAATMGTGKLMELKTFEIL